MRWSSLQKIYIILNFLSSIQTDIINYNLTTNILLYSVLTKSFSYFNCGRRLRNENKELLPDHYFQLNDHNHHHPIHNQRCYIRYHNYHPHNVMHKIVFVHNYHECYHNRNHRKDILRCYKSATYNTALLR